MPSGETRIRANTRPSGASLVLYQRITGQNLIGRIPVCPVPRIDQNALWRQDSSDPGLRERLSSAIEQAGLQKLFWPSSDLPNGQRCPIDIIVFRDDILRRDVEQLKSRPGYRIKSFPGPHDTLRRNKEPGSGQDARKYIRKVIRDNISRNEFERS